MKKEILITLLFLQEMKSTDFFGITLGKTFSDKMINYLFTGDYNF
jgi:hypothetical protein